MDKVLHAFLDVLPAKRKRSATGFITFDCPSCGDARSRGGFAERNGGFRYYCFNGGCEFNTNPTGWEPGGGLGGRPRRLFTLLGGDIRRLPVTALMRLSNRYDRTGRVVEVSDVQVSRHFDEMALPDGSVPLTEAHAEGPQRAAFERVVQYLWGRGEHVATSHTYYWSPQHSRYLIVPYFHHGRVVGWLGRATVEGIPRFIGRCQGDYIFNQDRLEWDSGRANIVVEGVMDGVALRCLAIRNARPTEKQLALLRMTGQDIIVLPDQETEGRALVEVAKQEGWRVAVPDWDRGVKDVCQAINRYGLLYATESIVAGATRNYHKARGSLMLKGVR